MFKRLTAILITLAMLFGMCAVVTADTTDPYEYLPRDVTIVCYSGNDGAVVAWKNPTSTLLTKVTVTDTGNNEVLGTVENPTPGGISRVEKETVSVQYGFFKVKFLFEFSNGEKREFYYTQYKLSYSLKNDYYTTPIVAVDGNNDYNVFTTNTQNTTANGKNSLMVVSNINPIVNDTLAKIDFNYKATASNFATVGALKSDTTYNFEYKVKTDTDITFDNYINTGGGTMQNNSGTANVKASTEWQTVSGSFKTTEEEMTGWMFFVIGFKQATNEPFYIDDVKITELDSNGNAYTGTDSTSYTYDFEDLTKTITKPTNVAASGSDGAATITWSVDSNTRYINIYEIVDGKKVLRNRMNGNPNSRDSSVDIHYLTNGKTYKFAVSAMTFEGVESEAVEVTVTPEKAEIDKYKYEPANVMITGWRDQSPQKHKGYKVSWTNPTAEISSVKLYEIQADGIETEKTPSRIFEPKQMQSYPQSNTATITTSGAVVFCDVQGLDAESGSATYRLVFDFADGQKRDIIYSGKWRKGSGYSFVSQEGKEISVYPYVEGGEMKPDGTVGSNYSMTGANGIKISAEKHTDKAQLSMKLTSNQSAYDCSDYIYVNTGSEVKKDSTYNFEMDVNTIQPCAIYLDKNNRIELPNTNGEWKKINGTYKALADQKDIVLSTGIAMRETYIDNIHVYNDNKSIDATYSFSDITQALPDKVTGVTAEQNGKNSAIVSWETAGTEFVNVYEDIDENLTDDVHTWMLRARVPSSQNSVTLNNLETDKTHNFMVTTESNYLTYEGLESAGVTCSATLVMPDYEINDVKLLAEGAEVQKLMPGGKYTAQANVTNAKIDEGLKTQIIVAVYADGVLENCVVSDAKTIAKGTSETITVPNVSISNKADAEKYTVKIMVWKGLESVTPLLKNSVTYTTAE